MAYLESKRLHKGPFSVPGTHFQPSRPPKGFSCPQSPEEGREESETLSWEARSNSYSCGCYGICSVTRRGPALLQRLDPRFFTLRELCSGHPTSCTQDRPCSSATHISGRRRLMLPSREEAPPILPTAQALWGSPRARAHALRALAALPRPGAPTCPHSPRNTGGSWDAGPCGGNGGNGENTDRWRPGLEHRRTTALGVRGLGRVSRRVRRRSSAAPARRVWAGPRRRRACCSALALLLAWFL